MAGIADLGPVAIPAGSSLKDAIQAIEVSKLTIAVVVDGEHRVLGTVSDGDIRRAVLGGTDLGSPVAPVMNSRPVTAADGVTDSELIELLRRRNLEAVPVVDAGKRLLRVAHIDELVPGDAIGGGEGFHAAVIMAGGEGRRLRPLTDHIPKPMVEIGGVPLIEQQVKRLARAGIRRIYVAVHYLSGVIEQHLGDGSRFGTNIVYLRERTKLGTGGALSLLPEPPDAPLLVLNGDVLTTSEFRNFLNFHREHGAAVTVGAVSHRIQVPYGVIRCDGVKAVSLEEKPSQTYLCNAGIYVISPDILAMVPRDEFFNMTDLMTRCMQGGHPVVVFPIHEYWSDIGTPRDLEEARVRMGALDEGRR